jgi:hypothetical protein
MGKGGGAGKVYFVLYLAVVLELLIIIVERDEAEEHLVKKQKDSMRIVESILSQLQSGAGTEGMNTRPQDEITIPPPGVDLKDALGTDINPEREYIIEIGVTDVSHEIRKREGESKHDYHERVKKLIKLANVEQVQYQIFFSNDPRVDEAPVFPTEATMSGLDIENMQPGEIIVEETTSTPWKYLGSKELKLDNEKAYENIKSLLDAGTLNAEAISPVYPEELKNNVGPALAPTQIPTDSIFYYSDKHSRDHGDDHADIKKRAFVVNFLPPSEAGWYKLRFASRTNRILGVKSGLKFDELGDEATVNIGTVQLSVKDLKHVYKGLRKKLDKYMLPAIEDLVTEKVKIGEFNKSIGEAIDKTADETHVAAVKGNIQLYGYIVKLLVPGLSSTFDQNRGSMEIDVHVLTPNPPDAPPTMFSPNYTATFDAAPAVFECSIAPYKQTQNVIEGKVLDNTGNVAARIEFKPLYQIPGSNVAEPTKDTPLELRATTDKKLAPGNYTIEVTHKLRGKVATSVTKLDVFETGLTEKSIKAIKSKLDMSAYYSYKTSFTAIANSGTKIKSDQFRIYLTTDDNPQKPYIEGLTLDKSDAIAYTPDSREVSIKITWLQPYTNKEIELLPTITQTIRQDAPSISTAAVMHNYSGSTRKFKVETTGLNVGTVSSGDDNVGVDYKVEIASVEKADGLKEYNFSTEPILSGSASEGYVVEFEMSGKPDKGKKKARGTVTVTLNVTAINQGNGVASTTESVSYSVPVSYSGAKTRRRR